MKKKRILVTGGAGFIGSEVVAQLIEGGAFVRVLDNLTSGREENLDAVRGGNLELCIADIRDGEAVKRALEGCSMVFHLACCGVRHSIHSPAENHEVNATGTLNLLKQARKAAVERFVYVSSSEVYGSTRTAPMNEEHPTLPLTVYGSSKLAGDCYARAFHRTYGLSTVIVRPFNSYGPRSHHEGDLGEVIPRFVLRAMTGRPLVIFGDGEQTRDFTFVRDTARGIIAAGMSEKMTGETVNIGSGSEVSIKDLAVLISGLVSNGRSVLNFDQPRPGDVRRLIADNSRARQLFGYQPQVTLQEGIGQLMAYYRSCAQSPEQLLENETLHNWIRTGRE